MRRKNRTPPPIGSTYVKTFKGRTVKMTVVETRDSIAYRVGRGDYASPSGAAKSVTKKEQNGWLFWGIDK